MRKKGRETRNSGRCHSTVHKPYEILIMAVVNTLRKRRILRDDWFVNPTRYLIIRFVFEFSSLVLPIQYNFTIVSNRLIDRMEHLFQRREFFIRIVLLFFYFSKKKKRNPNHRPHLVPCTTLSSLHDLWVTSSATSIAPFFESSRIARDVSSVECSNTRGWSLKRWMDHNCSHD